MPLRMCVACREMKEKSELIRVVCIKGEEPKTDKSFKAQGRGAYVCRAEKCVEMAKRKKAFERAFSCKADYLYEEILGELSQNEQ